MSQNPPENPNFLVSKEDEQAFFDRIDKSVEPQKQRTSFRRFIIENYAQLIEKMKEKGLTRSELYEVMLDDEQKAKVKKNTFLAYMHAGKLAHEEAVKKERKEGKGTKSVKNRPENAAKETDSDVSHTGDIWEKLGSSGKKAGEVDTKKYNPDNV